MNHAIHPTPLGDVVILGDADAITGLYFTDGRRPEYAALAQGEFPTVATQLDAYFAGTLQRFDLPLRLVGTPFQQRMWTALLDVPYGSTRTYATLARELGTGPRAVGLANGRNPLSIVVPCHRLVGTNGSLTGYGGGLHRKQALLELEGAW
jgi:methylated-DNA-[protein]-cysteine S-methyltransferase